MEIPHFFFTLNQHLSAVKADYVEEVFALPELILLPNAPLSIVGVIDLRGDVLPILDLQLITETQPEPYQLTDSVVVLKHAELRLGIVVKSVQGLRDISLQEVDPDLTDYQAQINQDARRFISGKVTTEEPFLVLSEPKNWFNPGEIQQVISVTSFLINEIYGDAPVDSTQSRPDDSEQTPLTNQTNFCPNETLEAQMMFRQRAENLRQSVDENPSIEGAKTFVIVSLNNKLFGLDSQSIREFITVTEATPIPCCPTHIIGHINLRGEILTIIDVGKVLGLELNTLKTSPKAVVAELEGTTVGIVVEDIRDAMFTINPHSIQGITDPALAMKRDYIQGTATYQHQTMHILDISPLLQSDELVVNERI